MGIPDRQRRKSAFYQGLSGIRRRVLLPDGWKDAVSAVRHCHDPGDESTGGISGKQCGPGTED